MEDRNRNQGGGYQQQNSNWQNDQDKHNRPQNQSQQYDNNYNRNDNNNQNWNNWQNSGHDDNQRNEGGQYGNDYNSPYQSRNRGYSQQSGQQGGGYGNQQWRENNWNRNEDQWGSAGMYGGDFGRDDWERTNSNRQGGRQSFGGNQNRNWQDSNYGGYSPGFNEQNRFSGNRNRPDYNRRSDDRGWWDRTREKVSAWFNDDDDDDRRRSQNQYSSGHRGKGPKDYQRSSDRIREDICDRLSDDDSLDATHIEVQVQGNEVILTGTVNERYQKRYAEDLVESVSGVRHVENRIRVGTPSGDLSAHDYTGNTDKVGGIGTESGTTNEIIRNVANDKNGNR